jgi:uridine kinase
MLNISCDSISTDSFLIDRAERINQHISGYNLKALKNEDLLNTLNTIQQKISYEYFPYNSITGKNLSEGKFIRNIDVLIVEGIHAFNKNILDKIVLKVFIDSNEETLRKLRFNANINKRRFLKNDAGKRIDNEIKDYYEFVAPNKKYADIIIQIDENYNYQ